MGQYLEREDQDNVGSPLLRASLLQRNPDIPFCIPNKKRYQGDLFYR
jgi:hypothetical protein